MHITVASNESQDARKYSGSISNGHGTNVIRAILNKIMKPWFVRTNHLFFSPFPIRSAGTKRFSFVTARMRGEDVTYVCATKERERVPRAYARRAICANVLIARLPGEHRLEGVRRLGIACLAAHVTASRHTRSNAS